MCDMATATCNAMLSSALAGRVAGKVALSGMASTASKLVLSSILYAYSCFCRAHKSADRYLSSRVNPLVGRPPSCPETVRSYSRILCCCNGQRKKQRETQSRTSRCCDMPRNAAVLVFMLASVLGRETEASKRTEKKWANVKVVNQVDTKVRLTSSRLLPKTVLSSGEILVYHRRLDKKAQKALITLQAEDAYTGKPLIINGKSRFRVKPMAFDVNQDAYVTKLGKSNQWFYVKFTNDAGTRVKLTPNQILPSTNLQPDEVQVNYARLEPGYELKRIILRAEDVKTHEPLKLNGEYTLALRPDDSGNIAKVKVTQGDPINARCDKFVSWNGTFDGPHQYQIVTDDAKNWFDALRACKVCDADLLSVHSPEENRFVTKQLRKSADIHKLWIGMTYREKSRMWSWSDNSRYRFQNWKEGQHYDGTDEQCGIVYQQYDWGQWDDDNCYKPLGFVCKRLRKKSRVAEGPGVRKDMVAKPENVGCSSVYPSCPSLCRVVQLPGACFKCDCSSLAQRYDELPREDETTIQLQTNQPSEEDPINKMAVTEMLSGITIPTSEAMITNGMAKDSPELRQSASAGYGRAWSEKTETE